MIETVKTAAVFGAGLMGGGIAAQFANAALPVLLFDKPGLAEVGMQRQLSAGGFMHPGRAKLVRPCDVEADLDRLADADWIVEAVVEDLAIKRDLLARIDAARKAGGLVQHLDHPTRLPGQRRQTSVRQKLRHYPLLQSAPHNAPC